MADNSRRVSRRVVERGTGELEPSPVPEKRLTRSMKKKIAQDCNDSDSEDSDFSCASVESDSSSEDEEPHVEPPKKKQSLVNCEPKQEGFTGSGIVSTITGARKVENVLNCLDQLKYGPRKSFGLHLKTVQNLMVKKSIKNLTTGDFVARFRITNPFTSICWHARYPYALASGTKFGDIVYLRGTPNENRSDPEGDTVKFSHKREIQGPGHGNTITAMKFDDHDLNVLYHTTLNGTVSKTDLEHQETFVYDDSIFFNRFYFALDINFSRSTLLAGDNKGLASQFSIDGKLMNTWKLHNSKIHHLEFNKHDTNLLVSCSTGKSESVKIWDIRSMRSKWENKLQEPLHSFDHKAGVNCARFSPIDGSRLLTSDLHDEIRVYQGPLWTDYLKIQHLHRYFAHWASIKPDWHPVNEYILIGRYSLLGQGKPKGAKRAIEFFDSYSGKFVDAIYPPMDQLCSLNVFNPTGEYLATGMNSKLILWKPGVPLEVSENFSKKPTRPTLSSSTRNLLRGRGRQTREYSPASSEDEGDGGKGPPRKKKKSTGPTQTYTTSTSGTGRKHSSKRK